jgi:hypothetical protein
MMGKGIAGPAETDYRIKQSASAIRMAIKISKYSQHAIMEHE